MQVPEPMGAIASAEKESSQVSEQDVAILFGPATKNDVKPKSSAAKRAPVKKELLKDFDAAEKEAKQAGTKGPAVTHMRTRNR